MVLDPKSRPACFAFSFTPWAGPWMNRQQLLSRLGQRGWRVTYVSGALNLWDRNTAAWGAAPFFGQQYESNAVRVEVPGRFLPMWPSLPLYNTWAVARYCASLKRRAGVAKSDTTVAYLFWPDFLPYALALGCRYLIYHVVDNYARMPGWTREHEDAERTIVARANLLIGTTAEALARLPAGGTAPRRVLHNGANAAVFARGPGLPCPEDLIRIPSPRICYTGWLNRKVDFNLIAAIARARPAWHWVLIGPVANGVGHPSRDPDIAEGYAACCGLPNVHFLGGKSVEELPAYVGHADINVMCYRRDGSGWWLDVYPLKLHEYLACGKPVISTPLTSVQPFAGVVDLATSCEEWVRAIERAIFQGGVGSPAQRAGIAFENTWDLRVDQLETWLYEMAAT